MKKQIANEQKMIYVTVGNSIRLLRVQNNMTQLDLACCLKMSRASISNIENGSQHVSVHLLCDIAKFFKVSVSMLFQEKKNSEDSIQSLRYENEQLKTALEKIKAISERSLSWEAVISGLEKE